MLKPFSFTSHFQIAKGPVHILIDQTICSEDTAPRTIYLKSSIHGFKIANLDQEGDIIEGKVITIEGNESTSTAIALGNALWDIFKEYRQPITLCDDIKVEPTAEDSVRIKQDGHEVTVLNTEIPDLISWLITISGIPYRPNGQCP